MAEVTNLETRLSERATALKRNWELLKAKAAPMTQEGMLDELSACLGLCAPVGMTEGERETWLLLAMKTLEGIPAEPFAMAAKEARQKCDHPAKIVPFIFNRSEEWASWIKRDAQNAYREWQNVAAGRLEDRSDEPQSQEDRDFIFGEFAKLREAWKAQ